MTIRPPPNISNTNRRAAFRRFHVHQNIENSSAQVFLDPVKKVDQPAVKKALHNIMNASNLRSARSQARRFAQRWSVAYPNVVNSLRTDLDDLLSCFRYPTLEQRKAVRTTNAIERRFREVRRRTRPMGVFQDRTSMDRILFAVFTHENRSQGVPSLFSLTQSF